MADPTTIPNVDPLATATADAVGALIDVINKGTTPAMLDAQRILMERIALEGNVIPSRIKPPQNITEIGGYLNLLESLGQHDAEAEMVASILGIAGAGFAPGSFAEPPAIVFARIANDRPSGTTQATIPTHITVRADFVDTFLAALGQLHALGCMLPLLSPTRALPPMIVGQSPAIDILPLLGRALDVVPATLAAAPDTDALALARTPPGGTAPYTLVARELDGGTLVSAQSWEALTCTPSACAPSTGSRQYAPVAPLFAPAGWYPLSSYVAPSDSTSLGSPTRLVNITGLVAGTTRLGDELQLLYTRAEISASALAMHLADVWNGTTFAPSGP